MLSRKIRRLPGILRSLRMQASSIARLVIAIETGHQCSRVTAGRKCHCQEIQKELDKALAELANGKGK